MNLVCFSDHKGGDAIVRIREGTISLLATDNVIDLMQEARFQFVD
jgi:hypothetical protein